MEGRDILLERQEVLEFQTKWQHDSPFGSLSGPIVAQQAGIELGLIELSPSCDIAWEGATIKFVRFALMSQFGGRGS